MKNISQVTSQWWLMLTVNYAMAFGPFTDQVEELLCCNGGNYVKRPVCFKWVKSVINLVS